MKLFPQQPWASKSPLPAQDNSKATFSSPIWPHLALRKPAVQVNPKAAAISGSFQRLLALHHPLDLQAESGPGGLGFLRHLSGFPTLKEEPQVLLLRHLSVLGSQGTQGTKRLAMTLSKETSLSFSFLRLFYLWLGWEARSWEAESPLFWLILHMWCLPHTHLGILVSTVFLLQWKLRQEESYSNILLHLL